MLKDKSPGVSEAVLVFELESGDPHFDWEDLIIKNASTGLYTRRDSSVALGVKPGRLDRVPLLMKRTKIPNELMEVTLQNQIKWFWEVVQKVIEKATETRRRSQSTARSEEQKKSSAIGEKQKSLAIGGKQKSSTSGEKQKSSTSGEKQESSAIGEKQKSSASGEEKKESTASGKKKKKKPTTNGEEPKKSTDGDKVVEAIKKEVVIKEEVITSEFGEERATMDTSSDVIAVGANVQVRTTPREPASLGGPRMGEELSAPLAQEEDMDQGKDDDQPMGTAIII